MKEQWQWPDKWRRQPWPGGRHGPSAHRHWRRQRGRLFMRFLGFFGFTALLVVGGMAALAFLFTYGFGGGRQTALLVWVSGCGLALALPILAASIGRRAFRGIAAPLADIMATADAVAEGDLGARVPEQSAGQFGQLTRSFNHMIEELQRADRQRRNLTADVAHELRTPLHIIQGNLEGILDGVYEADPDHVEATLDETRLLARLVDDLQTLSLAEAGELPLLLEEVDIEELLADVATSFSGQAEAAGVSLRLKQNPGQPAPLTITADIGRLDQVLSNLVANALRYTPAGGEITLSAKAWDNGVRLTVSDTGSGIERDDLPYIFDRFWRGDRARSHSGGAGSGLGLAIARQLVQSHQGAIDVVSEPGQFTTFTIDLPAAPQANSRA